MRTLRGLYVLCVLCVAGARIGRPAARWFLTEPERGLGMAFAIARLTLLLGLTPESLHTALGYGVTGEVVGPAPLAG